MITVKFTVVTGKINISPPLTWAEIRKSPYLPENAAMEPDVLFEVETTEVNDPDGVMLRHRAVAILPLAPGRSFGYQDLLGTLRRLVGTYGDGRKFTGFFECNTSADRVNLFDHRIPGDDGHDPNPTIGTWRIYVRYGNVVVVRPTLVWPDDTDVDAMAVSRLPIDTVRRES